jgi:hypothetical protein
MNKYDTQNNLKRLEFLKSIQRSGLLDQVEFYDVFRIITGNFYGEDRK